MSGKEVQLLSTRTVAGERLHCPLPTAHGPLHSDWLHLCNGLVPKRDGGMVPSILGMTGALARQRGDVTIVTPTPSREDEITISSRVVLRGPEADLEEAVR